MSKKRWFRLYIDQWFNGTVGMTPNEIAAYMTVICELYDHEGTIYRPDFDIMARRCGMRPTSFRKAFDTLTRRGKLTFEGGVITSKAVSEEIKSREKVDEKSMKSRKKLDENSPENPMKSTENSGKYPHNKNTEYRIQNSTTLEGGALHPPEHALEEGRALSPAVAAFIKRKEQRNRQARRVLS